MKAAADAKAVNFTHESLEDEDPLIIYIIVQFVKT